MDSKQPKIVQKMLLRTFFLLLAVAGIFLGIQKVLDWRKDPDSGTYDSEGDIAAIQVLENGQQAVIFDNEGKKIPCPDYEDGKTDRDIVWRPDGNRLFLSSDRKSSAYNLYRWNPGSGAVTQKGLTTTSRFNPTFGNDFDPADPGSVAAASNEALITQGGFILNMDLKEDSTTQVLPIARGVTVGSEEGSGGEGQLDSIYKAYGRSFRSARWAMGGEYICAIMNRDEGECFISQRSPFRSKELELPKGLFAGEKLWMDSNPKTGEVVVVVRDYDFPDLDKIPEEYIKNGKAVKPFRNGIFSWNPAEQKLTRIAIQLDQKIAFASPAVSPDGSQVAVVAGEWDGTNFVPKALVLSPIQEGGIQVASPLVSGTIYEPAWSPDGKKLVYAKRVDGKRAIFTIDKDGANEKKVSDDGDYLTPQFSPQLKK